MIHLRRHRNRRANRHNKGRSNGNILLTDVQPGQRVKLVDIDAGHGARHRLTELGLIPGVELGVIQDEGGPLLLAVHDSRLALGRGMAHKIMVKPL